MATSRAELSAQSYATRRRIAALITGDPAPERDPLRQSRRSGAAGVALAALTLVGAVLVGHFTGVRADITADITADSAAIAADGPSLGQVELPAVAWRAPARPPGARGPR